MIKRMRKLFLQKNNILRVAFVILTVVSLWYWDGVMSVKNDHGINQAKAMYYQPKDTVDVVMMGSSHIHYNINTGILWKDYGIASFDYSAAEQPLWITYHYLVEFCKYQKPKVMVLDLYSLANNKDDYQYDWIKPNILGMRFSINKLRMLSISVEREKIDDYFPSMAVYHDRFSELTPFDFYYPLTLHTEMKNFKGFAPAFETQGQEEPEFDQERSGGLSLKQETYLQKIIDFTKENDIELFLMVAPYITTNEDELVYNRVKEIANMNNIEFNSTNYDYKEIGLNFETDFYDRSHLNYRGAEKFTNYLGKELKSRFDIPDRRGEEGYESWDVDYENIQQLIKENT
ncbi:hypothetical protein [Butyrivibrio sp. FCS014]|uniref:hypothetical protein n=1 Tax=Butyrivibrio sp. FCS014 TaxID=1408304 RepID=UPI0004655F7C|nr:hypothetical protein [Butyrivibrio sp. FCS014]